MPKSSPNYLHETNLRSKIVATIGPSSCSKEVLQKMIDNGVHVLRLNMTHMSREFAKEIISNIRSLACADEIGIWVDVNGPKIRCGKLVEGKPVFLEEGQDFTFLNDPNAVGDNTRCATSYSEHIVRSGDKIYVDDGMLCFTVVERVEEGVLCKVDNSGWLGENKGINLPRHFLDLATITQKDKLDIQFAMENKCDFLSISCIRDVSDVEELRLLLGDSKIRLIAKIENSRGVTNFSSILSMADLIVIDRGYLGAELDAEFVPVAQKKMIAECNAAGKPVVIANQVLESMTTRPRPSRSEAADVSNAVADGTDGFVLSAETAVGKYVIETIQTMRKIAYQAENQTNYLEYQQKMMRSQPKPIAVSESIASSAVTCARQVGAKLIVCFTELGGTARLVAKYRPEITIIGATMMPQTAKQLNLCFGVVPYHHKGTDSDIVNETLKYAVSLGLTKAGDIVVITSGQVIGFLEGTTTKMQLLTVPSF
ncbi:hypothetical protein HK099_001004 [Clydaea vesicula]|uniref:Pyruvate kinase n=1 Tax=Clydaea vesicula TaxID=447962 RepID=A0AAD5XXD1_9FUNG|nr:hypothetical protein HK099_001004 [Clydaea vesicula]KAJ3396540.1 hypothetical protein HDU92_002720 [Lobulomyces angularis]